MNDDNTYPRATKMSTRLHESPSGDMSIGHHSSKSYGLLNWTIPANLRNLLKPAWGPGTYIAPHRSAAAMADTELEITWTALRYPAAWCESSSWALRDAPRFVACEAVR